MNSFQGKHLDWWYINLASRPDRMAHAELEFSKQGIAANRFEAFLPSDWNGDPDQILRMKNRTPGAVGCYMSHLAIMRACKKDSMIAVCEDDVCFAPDMKDRLFYAEKVLPNDWDIFYLGATFHVPGVWYKDPECESWGSKKVDAEPINDKHIMRVYGQWGTYAYFVNGLHAQKVIDALEENCHRSYAIDHNLIQLGDKINAYCFVPGMAWQYDNVSNIANGINFWSAFKSIGPYAWTENMNDFDPDSFNWNME